MVTPSELQVEAETEDLDVPVLVVDHALEEGVAHRAAHDEGAAAGPGHRVEQAVQPGRDLHGEGHRRQRSTLFVSFRP